MIPNTSLNVSSAQVSRLPIQISQIEGYFKGGTNAWIQVFDSCIAPAAGAVPVWEMSLTATSQFQETLQIARLALYEGCYIGVSSTEGTWTASGSTMDMTVWTDMPVVSTNAVGDKTTSVTSLAVWTEATGVASAKKLYQLIVTELDGVDSFVFVYADDAPVQVNPGIVLCQHPLLANSTVKLLFGDGLRPISKSVSGTQRQGCFVAVGYTTVNGIKYGVRGTISTGTKTGAVEYGIGVAVTAGTHANILAITN